jgi:hypothetical protein
LVEPIHAQRTHNKNCDGTWLGVSDDPAIESRKHISNRTANCGA